jgi:hypothetical protein
MDGKNLLSEDFVQVTAKISALNVKKEDLKANLKAYHEKVKAEIGDLEQEAADLFSNFSAENSQ